MAEENYWSNRSIEPLPTCNDCIMEGGMEALALTKFLVAYRN